MGFGSIPHGSGPMGSKGIPSGSFFPTIDDCNDLVPPIVNNFVPPNLSDITAEQLIQFDVTDNGVFRCIFVVAFFPLTGLQEVIHNGMIFAPFYLSGSSRIVIPGGFRYFVKKLKGWTSGPTIQVYAVDGGGNQAIS